MDQERRRRQSREEDIKRAWGHLIKNEFNLEKRYDPQYRTQFARENEWKLSRLNKALDFVIARYWEIYKEVIRKDASSED